MSAEGVVGRDRELAAVVAFLDGLPSGPCGLLLEGEAGIGKTTVWRAGVAWTAGRSYTELSCRPAQSETALSFSGLGDLLDPVLEPVLTLLPSPQRRALEVALLMQDPGSSPPEQRAVSVAARVGRARDARCRQRPARLTTMQCTASSAPGPANARSSPS